MLFLPPCTFKNYYTTLQLCEWNVFLAILVWFTIFLYIFLSLVELTLHAIVTKLTSGDHFPMVQIYCHSFRSNSVEIRLWRNQMKTPHIIVTLNVAPTWLTLQKSSIKYEKKDRLKTWSKNVWPNQIKVCVSSYLNNLSYYI